MDTIITFLVFVESIQAYVTSIGRTQTQFQLEKLFTIIEKKGYHSETFL
jgi:hypothetical protein